MPLIVRGNVCESGEREREREEKEGGGKASDNAKKRWQKIAYYIFQSILPLCWKNLLIQLRSCFFTGSQQGAFFSRPMIQSLAGEEHHRPVGWSPQARTTSARDRQILLVCQCWGSFEVHWYTYSKTEFSKKARSAVSKTNTTLT